jgi:hypothetical protein
MKGLNIKKTGKDTFEIRLEGDKDFVKSKPIKLRGKKNGR